MATVNHEGANSAAVQSSREPGLFMRTAEADGKLHV